MISLVWRYMEPSFYSFEMRLVLLVVCDLDPCKLHFLLTPLNYWLLCLVDLNLGVILWNLIGYLLFVLKICFYWGLLAFLLFALNLLCILLTYFVCLELTLYTSNLLCLPWTYFVCLESICISCLIHCLHINHCFPI